MTDLDALRESLSDAHQDDQGYALPDTPSEFDQLTTTQLLRPYQKSPERISTRLAIARRHC